MKIGVAVSLYKAFHFYIALHEQKKPPFPQKRFLLQKTFLTALESYLFPHAKSFSFSKNFLYRHPKQFFFTSNTANSHPAITYCLPKNTAVLLQSALTPYAVTPERRTDSKPFRCRFVRKTGFDTCRRKTLLKSSPAEL